MAEMNKIGDKMCYPFDQRGKWMNHASLTELEAFKTVAAVCPDVSLGQTNWTAKIGLEKLAKGHEPTFLNKLAIVVSASDSEVFAVYKHDFEYYMIRSLLKKGGDV